MSTAQLRHIIFNGIEDLPVKYLEEIADFVVFARMRALQPQVFKQDDFSEMLRKELLLLSRSEQAHLEEEFADYQKRSNQPSLGIFCKKHKSPTFSG